jgi:hypothetical protein
MRGFFLIAALLVATLGCEDDKKGDKGPNGGGGPSSDVRVGFTSLIITDQAATALSGENPEPEFCQMNLTQTVRGEGLCLPAQAIELWASGVLLGNQRPDASASSDPFAAGPGRVLGGGSGYAKDGKLEGAAVDLTKADALRGEDNLFHKYETRPRFDLVAIEAAYVRTSFSINGNTWEMIVPFYQQPVEEEPVMKQCYDSGYIEQAKVNANLFPGISFQAGDFLFCKRTDAAVPCELDQFGWFDTSSKALVSVGQSRPAAAKKLNSLAGLRRSCKVPSADGRPPDASYQMPGLRADLTTPIRVYGDFSHGSESKSNPGGGRPEGVSEAEWSARCEANQPVSPHFVYFVEDAAGAVTKGNKLNVKMSVDASNWIFLEGLRQGDLASAADSQILESLTTREFFAWEKIGFETIGGVEAGWKATLEVSTETVGLSEVYAKAPAASSPCRGDAN